ncbi:glycoside hydrolase family 25 protein [Lachnospira multipara]|uniref:Glycosyl hydrolases family 25 n=1 Tax=Lachnospira multipara TaxID=28051 RepID=A0A1H5RTS0_9FIRM|nr:glycoside hydrolase family 25 protein [Lachnospira multipara]SEF41715.1 Glycosyl hydrolases family 25 [Lachnospira multipara]
MDFIKVQIAKLILRFGLRNVVIGAVSLVVAIAGITTGTVVAINNFTNNTSKVQEETSENADSTENLESTDESSEEASEESTQTTTVDSSTIVSNNAKYTSEELEKIANDTSEDPVYHSDSETGTATATTVSQTTYSSSEYALGIDVSKYQGNIDWSSVASSGIDFAFIRIGYRTLVSGVVCEDPYAEYNIKQALANGLKVGVYFYSTATTEAEAIEEANWVLAKLSEYGVSINLGISFDYEGFANSSNRIYGLSTSQRTANAMAFLNKISSSGYTAIFYSNTYSLNNYLNKSTISASYKIWVAQYLSSVYPDTTNPSYSGAYSFWQYTNSGSVSGISGNVDLDVCYYLLKSGSTISSSTETPNASKATTQSSDSSSTSETTQKASSTTAGSSSGLVTVTVDSVEYSLPVSYTTSSGTLFTFSLCEAATYTPKEELNLRTSPEQDTDNVATTIANGTNVVVVATTSYGWAQVIYNGNVYYCVYSYLTSV